MDYPTRYVTVELKENEEIKGYITEPCFFIRSYYWNTEGKSNTEHTVLVPYTNYAEFKKTGTCNPFLLTYVTSKIFDSYEEAQIYTDHNNQKLEKQSFEKESFFIQEFENYVKEQFCLLQNEKTLKKICH